MSILDPAVGPLIGRVRYELGGAVATTVAGGVLVVAQAFAVSGIVVSVVDHHRVGDWVWLVMAIFLARAGLGWAGDTLSARAAASLSRSLRHDLLTIVTSRAAVLAGDGQAASSRSTGSVAALSTRGVIAIEPYLTKFVPALVVAATVPPLAVCAMLTQDWVSALIVVVTLPLVPLFAALVGMATRERAQRQWRAMMGLAGHFVDVVKGLPTLVAFRRAEAQAESIQRVSDRHRLATLATMRIAFASSAVLELVATLSVAMVAVSVGLRLADGGLDLGTAMVVLLLAPEAYWPLRRVGAEFHAAAEGGATLREISALIEGVSAGEHDDDRLDATRMRIRLDQVSVTYPGRTQPALEPTSMTIEPGTIVAIAGASGSGKSTLLSALRGGVRHAGTICVGGRDLADHGREEWARQVAWIPQRPWLVDGTIADNVRLAAPDASDDSVHDALLKVGLDGSARAGEPATLVGEDGGNLSAGERARLSLARAVVARRPLVLLDEPTAHLDADTERVVLDVIRWLATRSTVVVVAHREAVLDLADQVVTLSADRRPELPVTAAALRVGGDPSVDASSMPAGEAAPAGASREPLGVDRRLWAGIAAGALASCSGIALTATAGWLIVRASERPPVLTLLVAIIAVRTFGIARPAFRYVERLLSHDAALRALASARVAVYATLVPLTPGALGKRRGDLLASVVDDVDAHVDRRLRVWSPVASAIAVGVMTALVCGAFLASAGLVVAVLVLCSFAAFVVVRQVATSVEGDFVETRAALSRQVAALVDGRIQLQAWSAAGDAIAKVDAAGASLAQATRRSAQALALGRAWTTAVVGGAVVVTAAAAAGALGGGELDAPVAALLILVPLGLAEAFGVLPEAASTSARVHAALGRLASLAERAPRVLDTGTDRLGAADVGDAVVSLDGVSAGWGGEPVLRRVEMRVGVGERIAVIGRSGSGKSTLAALLLRFLDPSSGVVGIVGRDARDLRLEDVRRVVGLVDDDPHVFASTVAENVRLARPAANDDEIERALVAAHLGGWLDTLPDRLGTFVGESGADVSGGERARLGIARSLLADQPVLVLDEPVCHLDTATADAVLDDLLSAASGRTVVLITHRAQDRSDVDKVLDLGAHARVGVEA